MPKTLTTATKSLNPKALLIQGPRSLVELLGPGGYLHLSILYLSLLGLLGALGLEMKNALMPHYENAAANRLLKIEGFVSSMALNAEGFNNTESIFAYHEAAKQPILPTNSQKQAAPRFEINQGGSAPKAKLHS